MSEQAPPATVGTSITALELNALRDAFVDAEPVDIVTGHGGATLSVIFDTDEAFFGLSVGVAASDTDIHLSVSEWELRDHHERDVQVWHRVRE